METRKSEIISYTYAKYIEVNKTRLCNKDGFLVANGSLR